MFFVKNLDLLGCSERLSSKLTFGLRYHNLVAFFFSGIEDITGVSWQKTAYLQFSPKWCCDKSASVNRRRIAAVSAKLPAMLKNNGESKKNFDPGY